MSDASRGSAPARCITLFTDASSCSTTGIATWSAWAKYTPGQPTMRRSGAVVAPDPAMTSDMVLNEAYAIASGVAEAAKAFRPPAGTLVVIATDNATTAALLTGGGKPAFRTRHAWILGRYEETLREAGLRAAIRMVQSHSGTKTPRHAVNSWCDKECRRLMRVLRAERLATTATAAGTEAHALPAGE